MSPQFMAETAATSGFFQKNSQNKEGIDRYGKNYKLHLDVQKEFKKKTPLFKDETTATSHGRSYSYKWIFPKNFPILKRY